MINENSNTSIEDVSDSDESTIVEVPVKSRVLRVENEIRDIKDGLDQLNARVGVVEKKTEKKPPPVRQGLASLVVIFQLIDGLLSGGKDVNVIAKSIGITGKYLKQILDSRSCGRVCHQKLDFWFHPLRLNTQLIGFEGPTGNRVQRLITLENKSNDRVVFKLLTDDNHAFRCHPPFGYVEANSSVDVVVERMIDGRRHTNKIHVSYAKAVENDSPAWVTWAGATVIETLHVSAISK